MNPQASLRPILRPLRTLISNMMGLSHEKSPEEAEKEFITLIQQDRNQLARRLASLSEESEEAMIRARSAVLLEMMFKEPLDEQTQSFVKYTLLRCVEKVGKERNILEPKLFELVIKSLCHTIAMCFNVFCGKNEWPKLFEFVSGCVSGQDDLLKKTAMLILGPLRFSMKDRPICVEGYLTCLKNEDANVKIAAFDASISYCRCTPTEFDWRLVYAMNEVLTEGLNGGQEATTQEALKLLIEWAQHKRPWFLGTMLSTVDMMHLFKGPKMYNSVLKLTEFGERAFEIVESPNLKKETRHLAIDFLITLGKVFHPKSRAMNVRLFGFLILMLSSEIENDDDDAAEFLDRLLIQLHWSTPLRDVLYHILASSKWQERVAAIVALAQISKVDKMARGADQLVTMVLALFQDRVRCVSLAAINASGLLFTHLDPVLQFRCHHRVLQALATTICDFQDLHSRVKKRAVSIMVKIIMKYSPPPDDLTVYLHSTVRSLLQLLHAQNDLALDPPKRSLAIKLTRKFRQKLPSAIWESTWLALLPLHPDLLVDLQNIMKSYIT